MNHKTYRCLVSVMSIALFFAQISWAGQVVTEKDRIWAKQALAQEKSLNTVTAKNTVGILYFDNQTGDARLDPFQKGLAIMLMTDLSKVDKLTIVERVRIQALLEELGLAESGLVTAQSAPRAGRLLGARFIVGGDIKTGTPAALQISSQVVSVPEEKMLQHIVDQGNFDTLFDLEKKLAFGIIKALSIKLSETQIKELKKPLSTNMKALSYLFTGIDYSDRGKYQIARRYYHKAMQLDPKLKMAGNAIQELIDLKLVPSSSKSDNILTQLRQRTSTTQNLGYDNRYSRPAIGGQEGNGGTGTTDVTVKW